MQVVVYVLRHGGEKLDRETVRARPAEGWLYFGVDTRKVYPATVARLFRSAKAPIDVLEPITFAAVKSIDRGGILITGSEEVRSGVTHRQAWFCLPGWLDDLTIGNTMPGPYDPPAPPA